MSQVPKVILNIELGFQSKGHGQEKCKKPVEDTKNNEIQVKGHNKQA